MSALPRGITQVYWKKQDKDQGKTGQVPCSCQQESERSTGQG